LPIIVGVPVPPQNVVALPSTIQRKDFKLMSESSHGTDGRSGASTGAGAAAPAQETQQNKLKDKKDFEPITNVDRADQELRRAGYGHNAVTLITDGIKSQEICLFKSTLNEGQFKLGAWPQTADLSA
jgi:hypothetical protein